MIKIRGSFSALLFLATSAQAELSIVVTTKSQTADEEVDSGNSSTFTSQELGARGITSTHGLQYSVPGLVIKSSSGSGDFYLRGIGGILSATGEPGVASYVDGVYLTHPAQSLRNLFDIDRVDVIKGPHNTLLGNSVLGGAIHIVTQDPRSYRDGYADIAYGNYDRREFRGAVSLPLSHQAWSFRLAGTGIVRDGYSRNTFLNKDLDDQDAFAWRGKLRYRPSNKLDVIFSAWRSKSNDTEDLAKQPNPAIGVNGGILLGGTVPDDPREVAHNVDEYKRIDNTLYSLRLIRKLSDIELKSITAFQRTNMDQSYELDGTEVNFSSNLPRINEHAFSQELRISSPQGRAISWLAGLYYLNRSASQKQDVRLPLMFYQNISDGNTRNTTSSIFGELSYSVTSAWKARAGLRYSNYHGEIDLVQTIVDPAGLLGPAGTRTVTLGMRENWNVLTPEFGLSFSRDKNTQYFARVSRGYKPGGFNAYAIQTSFAPEDLRAYEAGVKTVMMGRKLRVHASLFYYDYENIQIVTLPPGAPAGTLPVINNAARASVRGLDIKAWYRPRWDLEFTLDTTLMNARFDRFVSVDPNNPGVDPDRSGNPLPQAPELSVVLGSEYRWKTRNQGNFKWKVDYRYQSEIYFNAYSDHAVRQAGYSLVGTNLRYENRRRNRYAELYASNLTNRLYAQNIIRLDPVVGTARLWGEPRTFGLRIGCRL